MRGDDYDEQVITAAGLFVWEGYDFCVLPYRSKRSGRQDAITDFILDFKGNYPRAVELGIKLIVDALARFRNRLRTTNCQYVLAAPPHGVGKPKPPSEAACKALADAFSLQHLVGALERIESVPKAAYAAPGNRPTFDDHVRTIRYVGPNVHATGQSFVLFDDLLTRGDTSAACRKLVIDATGCSKVLGVFLGRTK